MKVSRAPGVPHEASASPELCRAKLTFLDVALVFNRSIDCDGCSSGSFSEPKVLTMDPNPNSSHYCSRQCRRRQQADYWLRSQVLR